VGRTVERKNDRCSRTFGDHAADARRCASAKCKAQNRSGCACHSFGGVTPATARFLTRRPNRQGWKWYSDSTNVALRNATADAELPGAADRESTLLR
jgi:hypothetical protein